MNWVEKFRQENFQVAIKADPFRAFPIEGEARVMWSHDGRTWVGGSMSPLEMRQAIKAMEKHLDNIKEDGNAAE